MKVSLLSKKPKKPHRKKSSRRTLKNIWEAIKFGSLVAYKFVIIIVTNLYIFSKLKICISSSWQIIQGLLTMMEFFAKLFGFGMINGLIDQTALGQIRMCFLLSRTRNKKALRRKALSITLKPGVHIRLA